MKPQIFKRMKSMLLATVLVTLSMAAPHVNERHSFIQPDSSFVPVIVNGDEFYQQVEDLNGRTLVRDSLGWICYASLNSDSSEFVPGERYTGASRSVRSGEPLHIDLKNSVIAEKSLEMRRFYYGDEMTRDGSMSRLTPVPVVGERVGITILIDFSDQPAIISKNDVEQMLNGDNGATVKNFFSTASGGKLTYTNKVVGYYRARNRKSYYDTAQQGGRTRELIKEALDWLDASGFDFTTISSTNKTITAVNFLYAGGPSNGWSNGLWPHMNAFQWTGTNSRYRTSVYQITGLDYDTKTIGTFCHENGHMLLQYPDLYPYDKGTNWVGPYCLMSAGSFGNTPMPPNPYFRRESGWLNYEDITNVNNATIEMKANDPVKAIQFRNSSDSRQFIVMETIQKSGQYAQYAPANGMIAWKINTRGDNQTSANRRPLVEVAGGTDARAVMANRSGVAFSSSTTPAARWPLGGNASLVVRNLSRAASTMTFDIGSGGTIDTMYDMTTVAENGTITLSPAGPSFKKGTTVTVTAAANNGYEFESWSGDLSGTSNPTTVVMGDNKTITALFKQLPLNYIPMPEGASNEAIIMGDTLFYDNGGPSANYTDLFSGFLTMKPGMAGKSVRLEFMEFSIEDSSTSTTGTGGPIWDTLVIHNGAGTDPMGRWFGTNSPGTVTSTSQDGALTVEFYADEATNGTGWKAKVSLIDATPLHTVNITADNGTVELIPAKESYEIGEVVKLVPTASADYHFTGWGGEQHGFDDTLVLTIDGSVAVDAYFHTKELVNHPVYGVAGGNRAIDTLLHTSFHAYAHEGGTVDTSVFRTETGIVVPYTIPKQTDPQRWPGAAVASYVEQSLDNVEYIRISYRCESATNVQLQSSVDGIAPYLFPLEATSTFKTVDIPVSAFVVANWGTVEPLDLTSIINVAIAPSVDVAVASDAGTIEIRGFYLIGIKDANPVALVENISPSYSMGVSMQMNKMMVTLPSAGAYSVEIYSVNGRLIHQVSGIAENAGIQQMNLPVENIAAGVFITRLHAQSGSMSKMIMLK